MSSHCGAKLRARIAIETPLNRLSLPAHTARGRLWPGSLLAGAEPIPSIHTDGHRRTLLRYLAGITARVSSLLAKMTFARFQALRVNGSNRLSHLALTREISSSVLRPPRTL